MKSDICPYLFVYGTLRRGGGRDLRDLIGVSPKFLGRATAAGRLYDLGSYPG
ncbi:MAG TPA: gamma-glutamylcyclotransferase family protein, partial [Vicinamibacteria bacterium]|nr:gamma-glutamylcyclotransferase family protein [Vicinamibacteria bacterium]